MTTTNTIFIYYSQEYSFKPVQQIIFPLVQSVLHSFRYNDFDEIMILQLGPIRRDIPNIPSVFAFDNCGRLRVVTIAID